MTLSWWPQIPPPLSILLPLAAVMLAASPASAQVVWIGAAVQQDVQRFTEDVVPNRLDGSSIGWRVGADIVVHRHFVLATEWSDSKTIEDSRTITLDVNARTVPITSVFRHRTRSLAALAGYGHDVTMRVGLAYLVGVAITDVNRAFTSDAAGSVLVTPSTPATSSPAVEDRFPAPIAGVTIRVRVTQRVHLGGGVRAQTLRLDPDLHGWGVRTFVGGGWAF